MGIFSTRFERTGYFACLSSLVTNPVVLQQNLGQQRLNTICNFRRFLDLHDMDTPFVGCTRAPVVLFCSTMGLRIPDEKTKSRLIAPDAIPGKPTTHGARITVALILRKSAEGGLVRGC